MQNYTIKDLLKIENYLKVGARITREGSVHAVWNIAYDKLENEEFLTFFVGDDMFMKCLDIQSIISGEPTVEVIVFNSNDVTYEQVKIEFFKAESIKITGVS